MRVAVRLAQFHARREHDRVAQHGLLVSGPAQQAGEEGPFVFADVLRVHVERQEEPSAADGHGEVIGQPGRRVAVDDIEVLQRVLRQPHFVERREDIPLPGVGARFAVIGGSSMARG